MASDDLKIELVEQLAGLLQIDLGQIDDDFKIRIGGELAEQFERDLSKLASSVEEQ